MGVGQILANIFGSGVLKPILDKFFPDAAQKEQFLLQMQQEADKMDLAQIGVNQSEAESENWFVAGWRPAIGWVCAMAFAYTFLIQPFLIFVAVAFNVNLHTEKLPVLDWSMLMNVLFGMLGLGYLRTQEKMAGVSK